MVYQFVYASVATHNLQGSDIDQIVETSVRHNGPESVTSLLLKVEDAFIQLLEGAEDAVAAVQHRVEQDPRHTQLCTLLQQQTDHRICPCWSMGFRRVRPVQENRPLFQIADVVARSDAQYIDDPTVSMLMDKFSCICAGERVMV